MAAATGELSRQQLLNWLRSEVVCTIGSAGIPITIPVLTSMFREDTSEDVSAMAKKLGYPSIKAMLESAEFADIVESCYTKLAKGARSECPEPVSAYKVKSTPQIAHLITFIEESMLNADKKKAEAWQRKLAKLHDPRNAVEVLAGRDRLLECIAQLGGEEKEVSLLELQREYKTRHGQDLNRKELKSFFPTGTLSTIISEYLFDDLELQTDLNRPGSQYFKMKRPFAEFQDEMLQILREHDEAETQKDRQKSQQQQQKTEKNQKKDQQQQPKKREKIPPPPPRARVPPPPPKPKPATLLAPVVKRKEKFYTNDEQLLASITAAAELDRRKSSLESGIGMDMALNEASPTKNEGMKKNQYTCRLDGFTYSDDSDEEGDDEEKSEDEQFWKEEMAKRKEEEEQRKRVAEEERKREQADKSKALEVSSKSSVELKQAEPKNFIEKNIEKLRRRREKLDALINVPEGRIEGVYEETVRYGKRAQREEKRRARVAEQIALLEQSVRGNSAHVLKVEEKHVGSKKLLAAWVAQLIWTNEELGVSEVKNMVKLMFGSRYTDVEMDVEAFVHEHCKPVEFVRAPKEPHLAIPKGRRRTVYEGCVSIGDERKIKEYLDQQLRQEK